MKFEANLAEAEAIQLKAAILLYGGNKEISFASVHEPYRDQGIGVVLDIDVQGAAQVRNQCPDAVSIFLRAPSLATYEQRLRARGTETEASMTKRLADVAEQLTAAPEYDFQVVNETLPQAVQTLRVLLRGLDAERDARPA